MCIMKTLEASLSLSFQTVNTVKLNGGQLPEAVSTVLDEDNLPVALTYRIQQLDALSTGVDTAVAVAEERLTTQVLLGLEPPMDDVFALADLSRILDGIKAQRAEQEM